MRGYDIWLFLPSHLYSSFSLVFHKAWPCLNLIFSPGVGYSAQWQSSPMVWMVAGVNVSCTYCNSMVLLPIFVPPTSSYYLEALVPDMSSSYAPSMLWATCVPHKYSTLKSCTHLCGPPSPHHKFNFPSISTLMSCTMCNVESTSILLMHL